MQYVTVRYRFRFAYQREEVFELRLQEPEGQQVLPTISPLPAWTELGFCQCPHCPLAAATCPHCPVAASLAGVVARFAALVSHETLDLEVRTAERTVLQRTSAQQALGSLMGLLIATSGCPHTAYFRPMARFHLPLANDAETTYRATSMYLLAQYFRQQAGQPATLELEGLTRIYANVHIVNRGIASRFRAASEADALVNGVVALDVFSQLLPIRISDALTDVQPLFGPFLAPGPAAPAQ